MFTYWNNCFMVALFLGSNKEDISLHVRLWRAILRLSLPAGCLASCWWPRLVHDLWYADPQPRRVCDRCFGILLARVLHLLADVAFLWWSVDFRSRSGEIAADWTCQDRLVWMNDNKLRRQPDWWYIFIFVKVIASYGLVCQSWISIREDEDLFVLKQAWVLDLALLGL